MGAFAQLTKIAAEEAGEKHDKKKKSRGRSTKNRLGTTGGAALGSGLGSLAGLSFALRGLGGGDSRLNRLGMMASLLGGAPLGAGLGNYFSQDPEDRSIAEALSAAAGAGAGNIGGLAAVMHAKDLRNPNLQLMRGVGTPAAVASLGASGGASLAHMLRSHGDEG